MNYYEAKFARERKERPAHWVVVEAGRAGRYALRYLGACHAA